MPFNQNVKNIQQELTVLGYEPGKADGYYGPKTKAALERFIGLSGAPIARVTTPVPQPAPIPPLVDTVVPAPVYGNGKKVAIVIGHNLRAQGAARLHDNVSEYNWNTKLANEIAKYPNVKLFIRPAGMEYWKEIDTTYDSVNKWNPDVALELHFNASVNTTASGTETLRTNSSGSKKLGEAVQKSMVNVLGLKDRGVTQISSTERGGRGLYRAKAPAILLETYFGSNKRDSEIVDAKMSELARAIYLAAIS